MNRIEFMTELAALLQDVPVEERRDAMKFYNDYFDDAGEENEQQVIAELGSPAKVAATIKADLEGAPDGHGEFTEHGYTDSRFESKRMPVEREYQNSGSKDGGYSYGNQSSSYQDGSDNHYQSYDYQGPGYDKSGEQTPPKTNNALKILLIIALVIFGAPIIIPVALAVLAVIASVGIALLAVFIAFVIVSVVIAFAGVCVFIAGLVSLIPEIAVGLALIGTGLILTVVGVILTVASVRVCMIVLPGIIRGFVWVASRPFQRKAVV